MLVTILEATENTVYTIFCHFTVEALEKPRPRVSAGELFKDRMIQVIIQLTLLAILTYCLNVIILAREHAGVQHRS